MLNKWSAVVYPDRVCFLIPPTLVFVPVEAAKQIRNATWKKNTSCSAWLLVVNLSKSGNCNLFVCLFVFGMAGEWQITGSVSNVKLLPCGLRKLSGRPMIHYIPILLTPRGTLQVQVMMVQVSVWIPPHHLPYLNILRIEHLHAEYVYYDCAATHSLHRLCCYS